MTARVVVAVAVALAARSAHARGCHEVSDVVGYHHCSWFGEDWSREADTARVVVEIGYYFRHFEAEPLSLGNAPLVDSGATDWHTTASGEQWRVLGGVGHFLYFGSEIDGGGLDRVPRPLGTPVTEGTDITPLAIVGVRVFERERVALSAEVAAGFRYDDYDACGTTGCPDASQWRGDLEARARAEIFIHPRFSVDVSYGHSLVDANDRIFSVSVAFHGRVLDGRY